MLVDELHSPWLSKNSYFLLMIWVREERNTLKVDVRSLEKLFFKKIKTNNRNVKIPLCAKINKLNSTITVESFVMTPHTRVII